MATTTDVAPVPATDHAPTTASFDPADFPTPSGREEEWRFTPLARLGGLLDEEPTTEPVITWRAPAGVVGEIVGRDDPRLAGLATPTDLVQARARAGFRSALVLEVPAGQSATEPIEIDVQAPSGRSFGHVLIVLGAQAGAEATIRFGGPGTFAGTVAVDIGDGARLSLVSVQEGGPDSVHVSRQHSRLGRDAQLRSAVITVGGGVVRLSPTVEYAAPGGDAELLGLFFADAGQHHEHRVFVEHDEPHCRSSVVYKGALQGDGTHTVWIGDVLVRPSALGIDTYEVNRNLVLSDGARADSVPNLELETGEIVGAGHASATGRFDDEHLFYLRSRGIPADIARVLVVRGFFADILGRIGRPDLAGEIMARIDLSLGVAPDLLVDAGILDEEDPA